IRRCILLGCGIALALLAVCLWKFANSGPVELASFDFEGDAKVVAVAYSADGQFLAAGAHRGPQYYGMVKIWDAHSCEELVTLPEVGRVNSIAFSPDGKWLAIACANALRGADPIAGRVKVYECRNFNERADLPLVGNATWVVFSPDGKWLAAAGD